VPNFIANHDGFTGIDVNYQDRKTDFIDTSVEVVQGLVGSSNVELIAGYFPNSITSKSATSRYALVHLDCDPYAPTYAGPEFFYPRLVRSHNTRLDELVLGWRRKGS
jgi:hypothetical protein